MVRRCALVSDASGVLTEGDVVCIRSLIFLILGHVVTVVVCILFKLFFDVLVFYVYSLRENRVSMSAVVIFN